MNNYYTKDEYLKYGSILETESQIKARLAKHKKISDDNKKQSQQFKNEWYSSKPYNKINNEDLEFI